MAPRSKKKSTDSTRKHDKTTGKKTLKDEGKPLRKRARASTQKSASSKSKVQNVDDPENESKKKLNMKKGRPDDFPRFQENPGCLERLLKDIPSEMVLEVFCSAEPGDLLCLSRTSKQFRAILMSKRFEYIWRAARQNIGLPPPPHDLNEPQFAHLVFDDVYCYICKRKGRENILWTFRARVCPKCAASALPDCDSSYWDQPEEYCLLDILPSESVHCPLCIGSYKYAREFKAEFKALRSEVEREEWMSRKEEELKANREHAQLCAQWFRSTLSTRSKELDADFCYLNSIITRFDATGWGEEARLMANEYGNKLSAHRFAWQPKKLTDIVWECIKGQLLDLLIRHKDDRLRKEEANSRRKLYADFSNAYRRIHILTYNPIDNIIWCPGPGKTVLSDPYSSSKISKYLPDIIAEWRPQKTQELADLLGTGATVSDLHLATSVFKCKAYYCDTVLLYPGIFYHDCCLRGYIPPRLQAWKRGHRSAAAPWETDVIEFNQSLSRVSKKVVKACGPATATVQDLYDANPLIECKTCARKDGSRYFTWWPLILSHPSYHTIKIHPSSSAALKSEIALEFPSSDERLTCSHCHSTVLKENMRLHLETTHSIHLMDRQNPLVLDLQAIQEHWYFPLLPEYESQKPSMSLFEPGYFKVE
ncbi:hypothetical protein BDP27DRAFT_1425096 [Rhodocollybia butyracea]|uniref:F-box domain-containing protein n=1 Tax=Rhodocollybia butyracea TaxID=206335 RepID=A0A9P5PGB9_9AGAR|nr:hypothetical protein BDP27DRAFT_1425096 [Rhodocollybia butyracea]